MKLDFVDAFSFLFDHYRSSLRFHLPNDLEKKKKTFFSLSLHILSMDIIIIYPW